jgi:hypothetical protein
MASHLKIKFCFHFSRTLPTWSFRTMWQIIKTTNPEIELLNYFSSGTKVQNEKNRNIYIYIYIYIYYDFFHFAHGQSVKQISRCSRGKCLTADQVVFRVVCSCSRTRAGIITSRWGWCRGASILRWRWRWDHIFWPQKTAWSTSSIFVNTFFFFFALN